MTQSMSNIMDDNSCSGIKRGRETIHSGQFMVSHIEDEAKEEDDDDEKIEMPDSYGTSDEIVTNPIMGVQQYIPKKQTSISLHNNQLMIETSLSKLFNCMQLTYKQKLTSPKWNHFKGIRLSWKDKIRLNNLIWRCWHSQFIMKKKISMCQFASPIDIDLQTKPEAIVLEGKYWKRDSRVVCAEYRRWRRYYIKNLELQNSIDTVSEYSVSKDNDLDDYYDLLFSPIACSDPRDIGSTVRAEFIQPSLETLQPSLEDILSDPKNIFDDYGMPDQMDFFAPPSRLPPVPEEGSDDIYKTNEYRLQIMDSDQMDSNITEITNNRVPVLQNNNPKNQQIMESTNYTTNNLNFVQNYNNDEYANEIEMEIDNYSMNNQNSDSISPPSSHLNSGDLGKNNNYAKGKRGIIRNIIRREPHNYDKIQPTQNQTLVYNHIISQSQQSQQQNLFNAAYQDNNAVLTLHTSPIQTTTNNFNNLTNLINLNTASQTVLNIPNTTANTLQMHNINAKFLNHNNLASINLLSTNQSQTTNMSTMQNVQNLIPILSLNSQHSPPSLGTPPQQESNSESYKATSSHQLQSQNDSYKPYPNPHMYKVTSHGTNYNNIGVRPQMRHKSPPSSNTIIMNQQNNQQTTKEMGRSQSLPLNAKLHFMQKEEQFVVPKSYQIKAKQQRTRSNSMVIKHQAILPALQSATSEPLLNTSNSALLQQLLTSNNNTNLLSKHMSTSTNSLQSSSHTVQQMFSPANSQTSTIVQQNQTTNKSSPTHYSNSMNNMCGSPQSILNFTSSQQQQSQQNSSSSSTTPTLTTTPSLSPELLADTKFITNLDSPMSPSRTSSNIRFPRETQQRRAGHIHAEQKRRYNIKNGFDMLHQLIPQLQQNPNAKLSKAAMLQKGAEYIKQLRNERSLTSEQMENLKRERDNLSNSLNHLHSILPANGAPVSRQRTGRIKEMYNEYVYQRTLENWKFWIFGLIFEPLLNSFNSTVSVASMEEFYRTAKLWVDQNCSLVELRPAVSNKLRYLSTTTDILSDPPSTLHQEVMKAIKVHNNQTTTQQQNQSS